MSHQVTLVLAQTGPHLRTIAQIHTGPLFKPWDIFRCPLTLDLMAELSADGRFGRSLDPSDQTFIVISDSVLKQVWGRTFMSRWTITQIE